METLEEKIRRVTREDVALGPYDPRWPQWFAAEAAHLRACLPAGLLGRIEHFGSTAVPGLVAKPIVDMLIEVTDAEAVRRVAPPILEAQGYDYFWRPAMFEGPPFYSFFIRRNAAGVRTHHLHMVPADFEHWQRLRFRDYLIDHPAVAAEYAALKTRLAADHPRDRIAYTHGKTEFVVRVTADALRFYGDR